MLHDRELLMGGSSGGGGFLSSGYGSQEVSCETLAFRTTILNPDLSILDTVKEGDKLSVELLAGDVPSVIVVTNNDETVGFLTPSAIAKLIECLGKGSSYQATVIEIDSPRCVVTVKYTW